MPHQPRSAPRATELQAVREAVLAWYAAEKRTFPWRGLTDPWPVLVSELMLQQTQAARVAERFPAFMREFPTAADLAAASDGDVLAAWSGLGYNRRATALRRTAVAVTAAGWPRDVIGLQGLPGIGPYTARAIAALAFGQSVGAVDTNVRRWLVRRFGLPADASPRVLQVTADGLAAGADGPDEARAWMHASMEFGARICTARRPRCDDCPIAAGCPSRGDAVRVPVARQAAYAGSVRAVRGAILRSLVGAPGHALDREALATRSALPDLEAALASLERDGLAHVVGDSVILGRPVGPPATTTIAP